MATKSTFHTLIHTFCLVALACTFPQSLSARSAIQDTETACPTSQATGEIPAEVAMHCIATLQRRVVELEHETARQADDVKRYRAGLEAAVTELNKVRPRRYDPLPIGDRKPNHSANMRRIEGRPTSADLNTRTRRLTSVASVELNGRVAIVSGNLRNGSPDTVRGTLVIELLREGDLTSTARYTWEIPPHSQRGYEQRFELSGYAAGIYAARAWIEH